MSGGLGTHEGWQWFRDENGQETYRTVGSTQVYTAEELLAEIKSAATRGRAPGPGRPEIGPLINVRLDNDLLARVDAYAEKMSLSRAATIRALLAGALKKVER